MLRDAAQSVIESLKDQHLRDPERHETISRLLTNKKASSPGGISSEQFAKLVQLGKQLDDYDDMKLKNSNNEGGESGEGDKVDDEMGVAVVFDEDEDDEDGGEKGGDSDAEEDVVVDSSYEDEEEGDQVDARYQQQEQGDDVSCNDEPEKAQRHDD